MNTLDNLQKIKKLDPQKVLESIGFGGQQINQAWGEFKKIKIPASYRQINKVVINGMGGSGLPGHMLRSVFFDQIKVPVGVINSYQLPASLDKNTLYVISSYSGTTEEPLSTLIQAKKRGAKVFGIAYGETLGGWIKQKKLPGYVFDPVYNPSSQPRMGLGYSFGAHLALFNKLGLIKVKPEQIKQSLKTLASFDKKFNVTIGQKSNSAKKFAQDLQDRIPIIIASEFLAGNAHIFTNQINENAKTFASYFLIPELNHHLLEGLTFPKANRNNLCFVFFESNLYHPKTQIRYRVTKQVVAKNKIKVLTYRLTAKDQLSQALEMLVFGSYTSFYLAVLNNINPSKIPWVDYFKYQLKKYN